MNPSVNPIPETPKKKGLSVRRIVLLATTVTSLGVGALVVAPDLNVWGSYPAALAQNLTEQAHKLQSPTGFADIVDKVKPAVMAVHVKIDHGSGTAGDNDTQIPPGLREFFRHNFGMDLPDGTPHGGHHVIMGQGSGFFISADGFAVTNNHVVENANSVEVITADGKSHKAKVIGTDPRTDLALIKVDGGPYPYVKLSDKAPRIGDWVLAIGNPYGLSETVTAGILSARHRDIGSSVYNDFLQIDAPINKGNSGGPTFDVEGNVIGVNTAIYSPTGGSVGIAFAIPADTVKSVVSQLKDHGMVMRGWLGVQIQPVTQELADSLNLKRAQGALVSEPLPDSPGAKAGIRSGDVITAVNGQEVKDAKDLAKKIGSLAPQTKVNLTVVHDGSEKTVSVELSKMPKNVEANANDQSNQQPKKNGNVDLGKLGLTLAPANSVAGAGSEGVVVTDVDSSGVAAQKGFATGDVILQVAGKSVSTPAQVREALSSVRSQGKQHFVMVQVKKGNNTHFLTLPVGKG